MDIKLSNAELAKELRVLSVAASLSDERRLNELGIVKGAHVTAILYAPMKETMLLRAGASLVALRMSLCENVVVEYV